MTAEEESEEASPLNGEERQKEETEERQEQGERAIDEPEWYELYRSERRERIARLMHDLDREKKRAEEKKDAITKERESSKKSYEEAAKRIQEKKDVFCRELEIFQKYRDPSGLPSLHIYSKEALDEVNEVRESVQKIFDEDREMVEEYSRIMGSYLASAKAVLLKKANKQSERISVKFPSLHGIMKLTDIASKIDTQWEKIKTEAHARAIDIIVRSLERRLEEEDRDYRRNERAFDKEENDLKANYASLKKQTLQDAAKDNIQLLKEICKLFGRRELSASDSWVLYNISSLRKGREIDYEGIGSIGNASIRNSLEALVNASLIGESDALAITIHLPEEEKHEAEHEEECEKDKGTSPAYKNGENRVRYPIQRTEQLGNAQAPSGREITVMISRKALDRAEKDDSIRRRWNKFANEIEMIARNPEERPREKIGDFLVSPRGYGGSAAPRIAWTFDSSTNTLTVYDLLYHVDSQRYVDNWNHQARDGRITRKTYERNGFEDFRGP